MRLAIPVLFIPSAVAAADPANLLANPGFEAGKSQPPEGWMMEDKVRPMGALEWEEKALEGKRALRIVPTGKRDSRGEGIRRVRGDVPGRAAEALGGRVRAGEGVGASAARFRYDPGL